MSNLLIKPSKLDKIGKIIATALTISMMLFIVIELIAMRFPDIFPLFK